MRKEKPPKPADARTYGYARVSTSEQKLDMQLDALRRRGVQEKYLFIEKVSGGSRRRPAFENMIRALSPGDTVVVWKMDRLGRKAITLLQLMLWFRDNDIEFVSITDPVDFATPAGRFMAAVQAAAAQYEVDQTAQRTSTGITASKERGNVYGRQTEFDLEKALKHLRKFGSLNDAAAHVGVTRQNLRYHVLKDASLAKLIKKRK
jgi:DNA invertase Pin-like site-specific DNA recombinase